MSVGSAGADSLETIDGPNDLRTLLMNRPEKANALDEALVTRLRHELGRATEDGVRLLVLRGKGANFCAGFDMSNLQDETDATLLKRFTEIGLLLEQVRAFPFLTAAFVQGAAIGAGADMVVACDARIGVAECQFRFPGSQFGLILGVRRLAAVIGAARAREVILMGKPIDQTQATKWGLLTGSTVKGQEDEFVNRLLGPISSIPLEALSAILTAIEDPAGSGDMSDLINSTLQGSLHARIAEYRASTMT